MFRRIFPIVFAVHAAFGAVSIERLVLNGDPVPAAGAGVVLGTPGGSGSLSGLGMTDSGAVTFRARLGGTGVDATNQMATLLREPDGTLRVLMREGERAPGTPAGSVFYIFDDDFVPPRDAAQTSTVTRGNDLGQVAFTHSISGPKIGNANDHGLWLATTDDIRRLELEGRSAPGVPGATFVALDDASVRAMPGGRFILRTILDDPRRAERFFYASWMFTADSALDLLVYEGQAKPGGGLFDRPSGIVANASGRVFFSTSDGDYREFLWLSEKGKTSPLRRTFREAPELPAGMHYVDFSDTMIDDTGTLAFGADLDGPDSADGNEADTSAIIAGPPDALALRVRSGDPVPDRPGSVLTYLFNPVMDNAGGVAFRGGVFDTVVRRGRGELVCVSTPTGLTAIAQRGDPAPGAAGLFVPDFYDLKISRSGRVVFYGFAEDDGQRVATAYWAQDENGVLVHLIAVGDVIALGGGDTGIVADVGVVALDDTGSFLLDTTFTDGRTALLRATLPGSGAGEFAFAGGLFEAGEESGAAAITVTRAFGAAGAASVHYRATAGTAGASDFTAVEGDLAFANGEVRKTFTIPLTNDTELEPGETILLELSQPAGASLGDFPAATLRIRDNDAPGVIRFLSSPAQGEGDAAVVFTLLREGGTGGEVRVDYATEDGDFNAAIAGQDYVATSGQVVFPPGVATASFSVPLLDDDEIEGGEGFTALLSNPTGGATLVDFPYDTGGIIDDDYFTPAAATFSVLLENIFGPQAIITLTMTPRGAFTGVLVFGTRRYAFSGRFDASGFASVHLPGFYFYLEARSPDRLDVVFDPEYYDLAGTLRRSPFDAATNPIPLAPRYTLALAPDATGLADATVPHGSGWATVRIQPDGTAKLAGTLADGLKFTTSFRMHDATALPFYATARNGKTAVSGTLTCDPAALSGTLHWESLGRPNDPRYPDYFFTAVQADGVPYTAPAPGGYPLPSLGTSFGAAELLFAEDGVPGTPLGLLLKPAPSLRGTLDPGEAALGHRLTLQIDAATGVLRGKATFSGATGPEKFSGVFLPARERAEGFSLSPTDSDRVRLEAAP